MLDRWVHCHLKALFHLHQIRVNNLLHMLTNRSLPIIQPNDTPRFLRFLKPRHHNNTPDRLIATLSNLNNRRIFEPFSKLAYFLTIDNNDFTGYLKCLQLQHRLERTHSVVVRNVECKVKFSLLEVLEFLKGVD